MKPGARALGIAESYRSDESRLAAVVVRADRVVDGAAIGDCTVGGEDGTAAVIDCIRRLDREDVRYVLVAGVAPAWYNILDLRAIHDAADRPVLSVSFEESDGLESALREQFSGAELDRRLETYRSLPPRRRVDVCGNDLYVRSVGIPDEEAERVVSAFTPEGGRPEPLRVARLAARAVDGWATDRSENP